MGQEQVWMVPYARNPFFTGRDVVLEDVHEHFQKRQAQAMSPLQVMSGLGGIGKTQIAVEYAHRYRQEYQQVFWASAETVELLNRAYIQIATKLELPEKDAQEQEKIIQAVKQWFGEYEQWLLILDNTDEPEVLEAFLPSRVGGQVLVTTRASDLTTLGLGFGHALEVETFTAEQGALFLLHRAGVLSLDAGLDQAKAEDRQRAMELSGELGGLPLALDQAGAYLKQTGSSLVEYQQHYQMHRIPFLQSRRGKDHPQPVATTWTLSFERVEAKNPAAADLLRLCAYLAPDSIPEEFFLQGTRLLGSRVRRIGADPLLFDEQVERLQAYSLLIRDSQTRTLYVHRLVQVVLREAMKKGERKTWKKYAVQVVNTIFPSVEFATWGTCERCLSHAVVCAMWIEQEQLKTQTAVHLLNKIAYYLEDRVQYREAASFYQQALQMSERVVGERHPDTVTIQNNLAHLY